MYLIKFSNSCFLNCFFSLEKYLSRLSVEQRTKLLDAANFSKHQKDFKKNQKKELEVLGKPKHPGNAFILFLSTLDSENQNKSRRVSCMY